MVRTQALRHFKPMNPSQDSNYIKFGACWRDIFSNDNEYIGAAKNIYYPVYKWYFWSDVK